MGTCICGFRCPAIAPTLAALAAAQTISGEADAGSKLTCEQAFAMGGKANGGNLRLSFSILSDSPLGEGRRQVGVSLPRGECLNESQMVPKGLLAGDRSL